MTTTQKITDAVITIITTTVAVMALFLIRNKLINDGFFNFFRTEQVVQAQLDEKIQKLNKINAKLTQEKERLKFDQTKKELKEYKQWFDKKIEKNPNFLGTNEHKEHKESIKTMESDLESKQNKINKLRTKKKKIKNDIKELNDELKYLQSQKESKKQ